MFDHVLEMNLAFYQRYPSNDLILRITQGANAARDMLNLMAVSFGRDALTLAGLDGGDGVAWTRSCRPSASSAGRSWPSPCAGSAGACARWRRARTCPWPPSSVPCARPAQGVRIVKAFQMEGQQRRRMQPGHRRRGAHGQQDRGRAGRHERSRRGAGRAGDRPGGALRRLAQLLVRRDAGPVLRLHRRAADGVRPTAAAVAPAAATDGGRRRRAHDVRPPGYCRPRRSPRPAPDLAVRGGEIRFEKVCFSYKPGAPVLADLDLVAPAGRTTALVGERRAAARPRSSTCCSGSGCPRAARS